MLGKYWHCGLIAAIAVITFASGIQQSFAHPITIDSSPKASEGVRTPPKEVKVFFSEAIELSYSKISVIGSDGTRVDNNDPHSVGGDTASIGVTLKPDLPDGEYTVSTTVLSAVDGHVIPGTFVFGIGTKPNVTGIIEQQDILSPGNSAARFPGMVGQVIVVGAAFATLWLWKPLARVPWLSSALSQTRVAIDRNMMRLVIIGVGLVLASGIAMIVVQAISIDSGIPEAIATKFGNVWVTRMLQSSILMGIVLAVYRKAAKNNVSPGRAEMYAILILGLAVLVTSSLIAHAAATSQIVSIMLDFFHNAAASIWIGGLILLGFAAVPKILAVGDEKIKAAALSILIPRFSTVVVTLLGIAVITGPVLLFTLESDLSLTLASVYGQILVIKLSLAGVMVGMGAYSQFVVQKRAVAVMVGGGSSLQGSSLRHYSRTLKAEAGVGIALLLAVSLMANGALPAGQFPAFGRQQADNQSAFAEEPKTEFVRTLYANEGKIQLAITPFVVGQNNFKISFLNKDGSSAAGIGSAAIKLTQIEKGIGPIAIETKKQSDNVFSTDAAFSLPGTWNIEIEGVSTQGSNMLGSLEANVKPALSSLEFKIDQYKTPVKSQPYYPVFDSARQSIWVGDQMVGSSRLWQLNITTGNYTLHKVNNAVLITNLVLAPDGRLWYIDPIGASGGGSNKGALGFYDPKDNSSQRFVLPEAGIATGLAMDENGSIWIPIDLANKVTKFEPASGRFSLYNIPTPAARPTGMASDSYGNLWFAELEAGKIAKIDPTSGEINEFAPNSKLGTLDEPTAVFPDPKSSNIYISEHTGHTITVFNSLLGTFREYPSVNEEGLPFGMTLDSYGNLWFAEHTIDRLGVIDPRTGEASEAKIPISGSLIQWITTDDKGKIWFAAQNGAALGSITITAKPSNSPPNTGQPDQAAAGIPQLPFSFSNAVGPAIVAGIVISALAYGKSTVDLKRNTRAALQLGKR
ncbi:MAG TPA: copper resistance protein CopC [Nitrososphaera sp.]|nr:copper resistance protein CopC [Nitrososphaera sp.]